MLGEAGRRSSATQLGVLLLERRRQQLEGLLGALDVGGEVPQVGVRVAVLLAGDLAGRDLLDELGGADGERGRRDLDARSTSVLQRLRGRRRAGRRTRARAVGRVAVSQSRYSSGASRSTPGRPRPRSRRRGRRRRRRSSSTSPAMGSMRSQPWRDGAKAALAASTSPARTASVNDLVGGDRVVDLLEDVGRVLGDGVGDERVVGGRTRRPRRRCRWRRAGAPSRTRDRCRETGAAPPSRSLRTSSAVVVAARGDAGSSAARPTATRTVRERRTGTPARSGLGPVSEAGGDDREPIELEQAVDLCDGRGA